MRTQKTLASVATLALIAGSAFVLSLAPAGAASFGPVDPSIPDGDPGSLRDIVENEADDPAGDTVTLVGGATYTLSCDNGQMFHDLTPLTIETPAGEAPATITIDGCDRILDKEDALLTVRNVIFTGGRRPNTGGAIFSEDGGVIIEDSTFVDNAAGDGGAVATDTDELVVVRSTFNDNCSEDDGGAVQAADGATFVNSTITNNRQEEDGAIDMDGGDLTLVYTDVVENTFVNEELDCGLPDMAAVEDDGTVDDEVEAEEPAEEASNIELDVGFASFGSVVALPLAQGLVPGDTPINCELGDPTVSSGYNYSDDDTCDFSDATDQQDAPDPLLDPLASNGGPTQTRLPAADSPLLEQIPADLCGGPEDDITTDQRGEPRPGFALCDIGAVELQPEPPAAAPVVLTPTFTG